MLKDTIRRPVIQVICVGLLLVVSSCRSGGKAVVSGRAGEGATAGDIDPLRAHVPLAKIEPRPDKPIRPATLKPLSTRAARQIPKAQGLIGEQRYTEAAIELERALRYDPQHPTIHRTLATLHWEAGNLERARTHATKAVEFNPDDAVSHYIRGRYMARKGDHVAAISDLRTAIRCSDFSQAAEIAALCHYHLGESLRAEGYLEAALQQYQLHQRGVAELARPFQEAELIGLTDHEQRAIREAESGIHELLGRFAKAAAALEPLSAERLTDVTLALRYARLLLRANRYGEALEAVREIRTDDDEVMSLLSEIFTRQGRPGRIVDELRARLSDKPDNQLALLQLTDAMLQLGRGDEARAELARFLQKHPAAAKVRLSLAKGLATAGDWPAAFRESSAGIALDPDMTELFAVALASAAVSAGDAVPPRAFEVTEGDGTSAYLAGRVALDTGRLDQAESLLRKAYELKPGFLPGRIALPRLLIRRYRYDEALAVAARADEHAPENVELELILGSVHERLDHAEQAEVHLKAAMQLDRTDMRAMFALAELFRTSRQDLRSQHQLRALLEIDPDHETAREMLAYSYLRERKRDVAMGEFQELARRAASPAIKVRCEALQDYVFTIKPDLERFREALVQSMDEHGPDSTTWLAIAESYDSDNEVQDRADAYRNALAVDPDNEAAAVGLVGAASRLLEFEEAAKHLETLARRRPNRYSWRLSTPGSPLGQIDLYHIIQDFDASLRVIDEMERREDLPKAWRRQFRGARIETLRMAQRQDELTALLRKWLAEEPDESRDYRLMLANEYLRSEAYDKAVPLLEAEFEATPDDLRTLDTLVTALARIDQGGRAERLALDWLTRDPDNDQAILLLVGLMVERERFDDAIELLKSRLIDTFDRDRFQTRLITVLAQAERFDECLEFIEALIDQLVAIFATRENIQARRPAAPLDPDNAMFLPSKPFTAERLQGRMINLRLRLADIMIQASEYREARNQLNDWLDQAGDPNERVRYLERLAACHRSEGDEAAASETMLKALALRPDVVGFNNDVAYGWIDKGQKLDKAEPMIRLAVSRRPRQAAYLDTFGWLFYKKGDFAEARKWLSRAKVANGSGDPVIHDHLGDTAWRMSRRPEAIEHWQEALEALEERDESRLSDDEKRVRDTAPAKIEAAKAGNEPVVAALAEPVEEKDTRKEE